MSESHDPWESARGSQREEVQAIWANRGAPPPRPPRQRNWRRLAAIVGAAAVVIAVVTFAVVPVLQEDGDRDRAAAAKAQERLEAQERARLRREGVPVRSAAPAPRAGEAELDHRARLVTAGEAAITADARKRIETGEIDGSVQGTACRTFPYTDTRAAQETDLDLEANRYQCVAFSRRFALPDLEGKARTGVIGQTYWLIVDYAAPKLTFCKITPKAVEGGESLAFVPVDPACHDPLT
ncbi:MAG: hypothetical protein WKF94_16790 [Solirubrobacteraceae bacterium]